MVMGTTLTNANRFFNTASSFLADLSLFEPIKGVVFAFTGDASNRFLLVENVWRHGVRANPGYS